MRDKEKKREYDLRYRFEHRDELRKKRHERWIRDYSERYDEVKEYKRKYYLKNLNKMREYHRRWHLKNRDKELERNRRYRLRDPDKTKERTRQSVSRWRRKNREKDKENSRQYRIKNPGRHRETQNLRHRYGTTRVPVIVKKIEALHRALKKGKLPETIIHIKQGETNAAYL